MTAGRKIGVIAVVPDRWDGIWMPRHHIVGRLAQHFDVVWIDPAENWRYYWWVSGQTHETIQNIPSQRFGLDVYAPGRWLPEIYRPRKLGDYVRRQRIRTAQARLRSRGCDRIVLYLWRPQFDWAPDAIDADMTCYHIDDEYQFSKDELPNDPREVALMKRVDQVIIHSRKLLAKKGAINPNTAHVPNGVEYASYATAAAMPSDLADIPRPMMGYVGVVKHQLDLELVHQLATRRTDWSFVLVGPTGYLGDKAVWLEHLRNLPNVHLTGNRELKQLPAYMQAMDVCMMCYDVCDYTNFIYPLKLNEYLATGTPVVSSAIDSVADLGHLVHIARGTDGWEAALQGALQADVRAPAAASARRAHAEHHDWDRLAAQVAHIFRQRLAQKDMHR